MNFPLKDLVPRGEIVATLEPLLRHYKEERRPGEGFGEYCHRLGPDHARALLLAPVSVS
jgi:sulfite reductase (ferredoxin)